jgi:hypothetical protein
MLGRFGFDSRIRNIGSKDGARSRKGGVVRRCKGSPGCCSDAARKENSGSTHAGLESWKSQVIEKITKYVARRARKRWRSRRRRRKSGEGGLARKEAEQQLQTRMAHTHTTEHPNFLQQNGQKQTTTKTDFTKTKMNPPRLLPRLPHPVMSSHPYQTTDEDDSSPPSLIIHHPNKDATPTRAQRQGQRCVVMGSSGSVKMLQLGPTRSIFQFFGQGARVLRGGGGEGCRRRRCCCW